MPGRWRTPRQFPVFALRTGEGDGGPSVAPPSALAHGSCADSLSPSGRWDRTRQGALAAADARPADRLRSRGDRSTGLVPIFITSSSNAVKHYTAIRCELSLLTSEREQSVPGLDGPTSSGATRR